MMNRIAVVRAMRLLLPLADVGAFMIPPSSDNLHACRQSARAKRRVSTRHSRSMRATERRELGFLVTLPPAGITR